MKSPTYVNAEDITEFIEFIDQVGIAKASDLTGYSQNSLRQCYDSRRPTRKILNEFAKQYNDNQKKKDSSDKIYICTINPNSPDYEAFLRVANVMGINLVEL